MPRDTVINKPVRFNFSVAFSDHWESTESLLPLAYTNFRPKCSLFHASLFGWFCQNRISAPSLTTPPFLEGQNPFQRRTMYSLLVICSVFFSEIPCQINTFLPRDWVNRPTTIFMIIRNMQLLIGQGLFLQDEWLFHIFGSIWLWTIMNCLLSSSLILLCVSNAPNYSYFQ